MNKWTFTPLKNTICQWWSVKQNNSLWAYLQLREKDDCMLVWLGSQEEDQANTREMLGAFTKETGRPVSRWAFGEDEVP